MLSRRKSILIALTPLLNGCSHPESARQIYVLIDLSSSIDADHRHQQLEALAGVLATVKPGDRLEVHYITDSSLRSGPPPVVSTESIRWHENPYTTRKKRLAEL